MREATALEGGMTCAQLAAWSADLRKQQGLPPHLDEPTALQHVADMFRLVEPPKQQRRRAG